MAARLTAFLVAAIVGVTLVAGLIVGAQREDDSGPIDLLIYNGRVYTGVAETPFAEAVAVRGNRIYRVGSNRAIKRLRRRATTVIDAHGGSVLAGFTDAQASLPVRRPELIDASGSTIATPATASGEPERTPSAGGPVPATAVREAIEGAHRLGLTAVGVTLDGPEALEDYERLREGDGLALRVVADIHLVPPVADNVLERIDALRSAPESDPMVRVDGVVLDVSLPADTPRSAARRAKTPPAAPALSVLEDRLVQALDRRGLPIVLRVEDERELTAALDALERAAAANPHRPPAAGTGSRSHNPWLSMRRGSRRWGRRSHCPSPRHGRPATPTPLSRPRPTALPSYRRRFPVRWTACVSSWSARRWPIRGWDCRPWSRRSRPCPRPTRPSSISTSSGRRFVP